MIGIVVSRADQASVHVGEKLRELADWTAHEDDRRPAADGGGTYHRTEGFALRTFDALHLHLDGVAAAFDEPALVVFASRHAGETGPLLTAHHSGNVGPAEYGGRPNELPRAAPNALAELYGAFRTHVPDGYDVGLECTHHGPSAVGAPSLFAELGSGPEQWTDPAGAAAVARAILDLRGVDPGRDRQLVGLGGGHYVPRFERVVRETGWAVGHVAADWALAAVSSAADRRAIVRQLFEQSGAEVALLDGDGSALAEPVTELGYRVVSETWLAETDDVDPAVVAVIEDSLGAVDEGIRFGDEATRATPDDIDVVGLPDGLLAAANGIDREGVLAAVAARTVAYDTADGGSRVAGPVAVSDVADRESVIDALVAVLREGDATVDRRGDIVVVTREVFDPDAARELGVPEGPAFGRLAGGEPVTVDGDTVTPEMVVSEETCRFEIR